MTRPQLIIIAGPNGSGKSTLTEHGGLAQHGLIFPERYINPDRIARQIADDQPHLSKEDRERLAWEHGRVHRLTSRQEGVSFACETVFSHPSTLLDMQDCKRAGYEVVLLFVTTGNVDINVERVKNRAEKQQGHDVDEDKIRSRYPRVHRLLPRAVEEAHTVFVFDSSQEDGTRIVFSQERIGASTITSGYDPPAYITEALIQPLKIRQSERLSTFQDFPEAILPDERLGTYNGSICKVYSHYVIQEDPDQGVVRHDRLLFPENIDLGSITTIAYNLDSASPVLLNPPDG